MIKNIIYYILSYASNLTNIRDKKYHYRLGTGISTMHKETLEEFEVKLNCFELYKELCDFTTIEHIGDEQIITRSLSFIKKSMMENMWNRLINNAKEEDINLWIKKWCDKAGDIDVVKYLMQMIINSTDTRSGTEEVVQAINEYRCSKERLEKKNAKHLRAIRILIVVCAVLLVLCISLLGIIVF